MKSLKRIISLRLVAVFTLALALCLTFVARPLLADAAQVSPADFFSQVVSTVKALGGLPWAAKIASVVLLVIASMKVSFLDDLIWNKLGPALQTWVAPILGLIAGIVAPLMSGGQITLAGVFAYMSAGAGAVILHELLDSVKAWPGLGAVWVSLIGAVEGALGGNPTSQSSMQVSKAALKK